MAPLCQHSYSSHLSCPWFPVLHGKLDFYVSKNANRSRVTLTGDWPGFVLIFFSHLLSRTLQFVPMTLSRKRTWSPSKETHYYSLGLHKLITRVDIALLSSLWTQHSGYDDNVWGLDQRPCKIRRIALGTSYCDWHCSGAAYVGPCKQVQWPGPGQGTGSSVRP